MSWKLDDHSLGSGGSLVERSPYSGGLFGRMSGRNEDHSRRDDPPGFLGRTVSLTYPDPFRRRSADRGSSANGCWAGGPRVYDQPSCRISLATLVENELSPLVVGEDPIDNERLYSRARKRFRSAGWPGLASRAYAAIDIALWDLKAKAAGLPLFKLLGGARSAASASSGDLAMVGSDAQDSIQAARPWLEQGVLGIAIEVGGGDVQLDADRVQQIRDGLGESAWLGVAVDGRYDLGTAMAMAHFYEEDIGIDWLDFPIPVEDRVGYRRLAERMEVPLALGSSVRRSRWLCAVVADRRRSRVAPDPLRLGGITPLLKIAAVAEAFQVARRSIPIAGDRRPSRVRIAECALGRMGLVAGVDVFEPVKPHGGKLLPPDRPGHGLELCAVRRLARRSRHLLLAEFDSARMLKNGCCRTGRPPMKCQTLSEAFDVSRSPRSTARTTSTSSTSATSALSKYLYEAAPKKKNRQRPRRGGAGDKHCEQLRHQVRGLSQHADVSAARTTIRPSRPSCCHCWRAFTARRGTPARRRGGRRSTNDAGIDQVAQGPGEGSRVGSLRGSGPAPRPDSPARRGMRLLTSIPQSMWSGNRRQEIVG